MAKTSGIRLLLLRSGSTEWDAAKRIQGATDLPLSSAGRAEIDQIVSSLRTAPANQPAAEPLHLTKVLCAPDEASRESARILAKATSSRVSALPGLGDMALGLWEGLLSDQIEQRYCRAGGVWMEDPCSVTAPEGEGMQAFAGRVMGALREAVEATRAGSKVGVVVRPIALGVIRCALNSTDLSAFWPMLQDRGNVEWYDLMPDDSRLAPPQPPVPAHAGGGGGGGGAERVGG